MEIRNADNADCLAIAELAQMAGDGIPGYFWADSQQPGQTLEATGAELLKSETANFSYRNTLVACKDGEIAGMLLAYRLPVAEDNDEELQDFPEFVRPHRGRISNYLFGAFARSQGGFRSHKRNSNSLNMARNS